MKPRAHGLAYPKHGSTARQEKKSRLERVFCSVLVSQDGPARAQHHRPVPFYQGRERRLAGCARPLAKELQQLPVGQATERALFEERLNPPESGELLAL